MNSNTITVGTIVKYAEPQNEMEAKATFKVIEDNGNRVIMELQNSNMAIVPTELALKADLIPA